MFFKKTNAAEKGGRADTPAVAAAVCSRSFILVTAINLLVMTVYYMTFVTTPAYVQKIYGANLSVAGFSSGAMVLGCLAGRFFTGNFISVFGFRKTLFTGIFCFAACIGTFYAIDSLTFLILQRFAVGMAVGITGTATGVIVAYVVPKEHHGFGISLFTLSTVLAIALGPFLGIVGAGFLEYGTLNALSLLVALVSMAVFFLFGSLPPVSRSRSSVTDIRSYIDPKVVPFSLLAFFMSMAYGSMQSFLMPFASERGLMEPAGIFFLCYAASAVLTRPVSGRWLDMHGANVLFYPIFAITALAYVLIANAYGALLLLAGGILLGMGFGNFQSLAQALSLSMVPRARYAQATTTFYVFFDFGIGLGPYLFGYIVPAAGFEGLFYAAAGVSLLSACLYRLVYRAENVMHE